MQSYAQSKGITEIEDDALKLLSQDLEYRLKELCQEAIKVMTASKRNKLSIDDINYALMSRNIDPLFGYDPQETLIFKNIPPNTFFVPDKEIDLEEFLNQPLPKIPLNPVIQQHWLAIEGIQPQIAQNPLMTEKVESKKDTLLTLAEEVELKYQNKHILSKELQLYFDKIISLIKNDQESIAIECLLNESGMQQLVPYFVQHFNELVLKNLKDSHFLKVLISLYFSLLRNKFMFIDPYLHQIIPSLLTCVVGKSIEDEEVRKFAAEIIKYVYDTFSRKYKTLAPRIVDTLSNVWLDKTKSEDSQYGALFCLSILSSNVVNTNIKDKVNIYKSDNPTKHKVLDLIDKLEKEFN